MNLPTNKPIVITSGQEWLDIDAFACIGAMSQLLTLKGIENIPYIPGVLIESITPSLKENYFDYKSELEGDQDDYNYVILDVSDPDHFAKFVKLENVVAVIDHHYGSESYWQTRKDAYVRIDLIGACATQVWEEFKKAGLESQISQSNARLLQLAIASNTLNFNAEVTHERDYDAFEELSNYSKWENKSWLEDYFKECSSSLIADIQMSIKNDTKVFNLKNMSIVIGQLELWDAKEVVVNYEKDILKTIQSYGVQLYFMTIPSIKHGFNYIIADNEQSRKLVSELLGVKFEGNIAKTNKLILRKEIKKLLSQQYN